MKILIDSRELCIGGHDVDRPEPWCPAVATVRCSASVPKGLGSGIGLSKATSLKACSVQLGCQRTCLEAGFALKTPWQPFPWLPLLPWDQIAA